MTDTQPTVTAHLFTTPVRVGHADYINDGTKPVPHLEIHGAGHLVLSIHEGRIVAYQKFHAPPDSVTDYGTVEVPASLVEVALDYLQAKLRLEDHRDVLKGLLDKTPAV